MEPIEYAIVGFTAGALVGIVVMWITVARVLRQIKR